MRTSTPSTGEPKRRRGETLNLRISEKTKELIARAALLEGQTLTEFVVSASTAQARRVMYEHEQIRLSEEEFQRFSLILTQDLRQSENAKRSVQDFNQGRIVDGAYVWD